MHNSENVSRLKEEELSSNLHNDFFHSFKPIPNIAHTQPKVTYNQISKLSHILKVQNVINNKQ